MGWRWAFVPYFALAVVAGLVAGFNVGGSPINALLLICLIACATIGRHYFLQGIPAWRLQLTWFVIYVILFLPLALYLGNPLI